MSGNHWCIPSDWTHRNVIRNKPVYLKFPEVRLKHKQLSCASYSLSILLSFYHCPLGFFFSLTKPCYTLLLLVLTLLFFSFFSIFFWIFFCFVFFFSFFRLFFSYYFPYCYWFFFFSFQFSFSLFAILLFHLYIILAILV